MEKLNEFRMWIEVLGWGDFEFWIFDYDPVFTHAPVFTHEVK